MCGIFRHKIVKIKKCYFKKEDLINLLGSARACMFSLCFAPLFFSLKTPILIIWDIKNYINDFAPDYIHLNDLPEEFAIKPMSKDFLEFLYKKDRAYKRRSPKVAWSTNKRSK